MEAGPRHENQTATRFTSRRVKLMTCVVVITGIAALLMADLLWGMPLKGWGTLSWFLFVVLFALIAFGFAQACFGFWVRRRRMPWRTIESSLPPDETLVSLAATAIVMPVYNEEVARVYAGLRATYESLARTGQMGNFDFFILSDSTDPTIWIQEEMGWMRLSRDLNAHGHLFYRRRRVHSNKKAGNIADFCRRWGRKYRYMLVLDADSVMHGDTLVKLVRLMECNPTAGIIQTAPQLIRGETFMARVMQFASRLYGPIFREGLNYWQQGEGNYWGHNAIIRVAPFVEYCALPKMPGREPFGGRILSHDFVEAALLRRAGWSVWLLPDAVGSYEEGPPKLIDYAKRDRRWCQGNLQHFWLLFARHLHGASRVHLSLGILAYASSLLWLVSLVLGCLLIIGFNRTGLSWLPAPGLAETIGLSPSTQGTVLIGLTIAVLFGPKALAVLDLFCQPGGTASFGGTKKLLIGVGLESLFSILLAPILMLFHAQFVVATILGRGVGWISQRRGGDGDDGSDWQETGSVLVGHTLTGLLWLGALLIWAPTLIWWMLPLLIGLVFSIPFAVLTGRSSLGRAARARGWFAIPEELAPPQELVELEKAAEAADGEVINLQSAPGLVRVLLDPYVNAMHRCLLRERRLRPPQILAYFEQLQEKLLREGPGSLNQGEQLALLSDADSVDTLHLQIWLRPADSIAPEWQTMRKACTGQPTST